MGASSVENCERNGREVSVARLGTVWKSTERSLLKARICLAIQDFTRSLRDHTVAYLLQEALFNIIP